MECVHYILVSTLVSPYIATLVMCVCLCVSACVYVFRLNPARRLSLHTHMDRGTEALFAATSGRMRIEESEQSAGCIPYAFLARYVYVCMYML